MDFSGNSITAAGLKAFDGILQINTTLKSLNLSGNAIGDEGAKVASKISILSFFSSFLSFFSAEDIFTLFSYFLRHKS